MLPCLLLLSAFCSAPFAVDVPGYASLPLRQQEIFDGVANEEFCGCDSALTLMRCLKERPQCSLAGDLAHVLVRASGSGAPRSNVSMFMSQMVLGPFCAPAQPITLEGTPRKGSAKAPLQVVEFFDYRCTHCKAAMPYVHQGLEALGKEVSLRLVPIALMEQSPSSLAAEAAMAAHAQGKFWAMHEALFAKDESILTAAGIRDVAKQVKLDMKRFDATIKAHTYAPQLKRHRDVFLGLGLDGTPAMFVNGRRFDMEPKAFDLAERLRMEQRRSGTGCQ